MQETNAEWRFANKRSMVTRDLTFLFQIQINFSSIYCLVTFTKDHNISCEAKNMENESQTNIREDQHYQTAAGVWTEKHFVKHHSKIYFG